MSAEENKAIIRRWIEAYNERDLEAEAAVLAPGLVVHVSAAPGPLEGLGAWRQFSGSFSHSGPPPSAHGAGHRGRGGHGRSSRGLPWHPPRRVPERPPDRQGSGLLEHGVQPRG